MHAPRLYVKKSIPVQVCFATQAGVLPTLEGPVPYQAGDALVTGVEGERWPVRRDLFDQSYAAAGATRFAENGSYIKRAAPVQAQQLEQHTELSLQTGAATLQARPGDWLVTDAAGHRWVVRASIFDKTYEPFGS